LQFDLQFDLGLAACLPAPQETSDYLSMLKLIGIVVAAMPLILFMRAFFAGSKKRSQAMSNFRRQLDYAVWAILVAIGVGLAFSIGKLIYDFGAAVPR
jgi:hypothetical protein